MFTTKDIIGVKPYYSIKLVYEIKFTNVLNIKFIHVRVFFDFETN